MVDLGGEGDLRRLEGIVRGEVNGEEEDAALVWTVRRSHDGGLAQVKRSIITWRSRWVFMKGGLYLYLPVEQVLPHRSCTALGGRVSAEVLQLLVDPFECHDEGEETVGSTNIKSQVCNGLT